MKKWFDKDFSNDNNLKEYDIDPLLYWENPRFEDQKNALTKLAKYIHGGRASQAAVEGLNNIGSIILGARNCNLSEVNIRCAMLAHSLRQAGFNLTYN